MTQTHALPAFALDPAEQEQMHQLYRTLHAEPELSMQEHRTAERIEGILDELGVEHFRCGGTGVVGLLRNGPGPVVAFRADTDGLPIAEQTGLAYASTARGRLEDGTDVPVMHGCGHDTHVASLVTATRLLLRERQRWSGTVVLIFQPGEETAAGARAMVADGLWDRAPRPEVVLGQHVSPDQAGTARLSLGPAMAMADSLRVRVPGRQTHGSQPQNGRDPIVAAAAMVTRLQTIVSRELAPQDPAVVTVGTFHAGLKENIIPAEAEFTVNVRTLTPEVREKVLAAVRRIIRAEAAGADLEEPEIREIYDFPLNHNHEATAQTVLEALRGSLGEEQVTESGPQMGSEDFGWLGASIGVPTVFWFFGGTADGDPEGPVNHSPHFGPVMEPTLSTGVTAALASLLHWVGQTD
ncbi:amidohydrolase [Nesterenkonia xinjiangensis]|uniref:Hippurate hydrolase n=1 Tax=Nesterenkonia xinjiangensis TaxID=225327 RepID=A0A7Z0GM58_9MICC|nr:amidohydrolase [Nesterenkonia xinjiangensis]NYJ77428.1 hippurate hydrolase [Nesterenkonia xinjiangensis]